MEPTLALVNGNLYTMDGKKPRAEAVAICGSRIAAAGTTTEVKKTIGPNTRVIDLRGKTVIPGITDAHIHFVAYALRAREVNLDGAAFLDEAVSRVRERVEKARLGDWVVGGGWDKNVWKGGGFPRMEDLDAVSPNNPVALSSKDGHTLWVNSQALAKASITKETLNPSGGEIERDPITGEATGILKENATHLIESIIPEPTIEDLEETLKPAIKVAQSLGITSVHVPERRREFRAFQGLLSKGELGVRVFMMVPMEGLESAIDLGLTTGFGDEKLKVGVLKLFADGALGSQTAAMLEPYEGNPRNRGIVTIPQEKMKELITRAVANGLGVSVHAIGDRANRMVLDVLEELRNVKRGKEIRFRIEHAQHLSPDDVKRFGELNVIASMQPIHIALDMEIADKRLGKRGRWAYPLRTLLNAGARLAFGSDCPVMTLNPFLGIYTTVTRKKGDGYPSGGWYSEECIAIEEAVRAYTLGGAYASNEEGIKGSIEMGKLADMVVLSQNIFEIPVDEIPRTRVEMTVFDGKVVYQK